MSKASPSATVPPPTAKLKHAPEGPRGEPLDAEILKFCYSVAEQVARTIRFPDAQCKEDCIGSAALHVYAVLGKWDPTRGYKLRTFAFMVARQRMFRFVAAEVRGRAMARIREPQPALAQITRIARQTQGWGTAPPPCCKKCREAVKQSLRRQLAAITRAADAADGDDAYSIWARRIIILQHKLLTGEDYETHPRS